MADESKATPQKAVDKTVPNEPVVTLSDGTPIPEGPWTLKNLGKKIYRQIAIEGGYGDPSESPHDYAPDLSPAGFEKAQAAYMKANGIK